MHDYPTYNDDQLIALLKEDDQQAFEQLYSRYWKKLFTLAFHKLQSRQDAEDIVHDIFASIWVRRQELEIQSISSYLAVAVKYKVLEYFNKAIYHHALIPEELAAGNSAGQLTDKLESQILDRLLQEKIQQLPEKCRIVFEQSRIEGKSNPEIARDLNISRKTVEKHISTALRQLRHSIKDFLSGFLFY
ncbi:MAG: RNA polymerase sigma factor [Pseudobacter sp.]|uniref:RNA polymerase sigma factor n=1 Tax=Pseudobacter sp. TaxID=2045420 RepID=UPI003F80FB55